MSVKRQTEQGVTDALRPNLHRIAFASSTGRLPQGFWKDHYVLGYLASTANLLARAATKNTLTAGDYGVIFCDVLDALAKEFSSEPYGDVTSRIGDLTDSPSAAWISGAQNANKVMAVTFGFDDYDDDEDVKAARKQADKTPSPSSLGISGVTSPHAVVSSILMDKLFYDVVEQRLEPPSPDC